MFRSVGISRLRGVLVGAAVLWLAIQPAAARSIYVCPGGDDGNPGTPFYPYGTLQKAADAAKAGDSVYVLAGNTEVIAHMLYAADVVLGSLPSVALSSTPAPIEYNKMLLP